jgi:two-component system CheB/CheR fusion protein
MPKKTTQQPDIQQGQSDPLRAGVESPQPVGADKAGSSPPIPVVGLGGSAGSLEAFKTFFASLPVDSGAAFVVIQHLAPTHESLLVEILAQHTRMQVVQAHDGLPVAADCVYVIPPKHYLLIRAGVLFLAEPTAHDGIRMPIDFFFRSLAADRQEQGVCIVFSGAGSDGALGVREIRGAGGLTFAQDPATAQFADMPKSAIATGYVDLILPPDRMPEALLNYIRHHYLRGGEPATVLAAEVEGGGLQEILHLVRAQKGCDFRYYKKAAIVRRIERRMSLHQISELSGYYKLLHQDADEVSRLFADLLINVTSFFRDQETFAELREKAIAPLILAKQSDEPVRLWTAGCATGEEAYTLAILLVEEITAARKNCPVQIFATDIDEKALEFARKGVYPESIQQDVGPERMARFFLRNAKGYQISESLRKAVVFSRHNLISDPPFSKIDIVCCRNLLIYLDAETQAKLMPLFNFALNPGGYLFLGKSEGIGSQNDLFEIVSKKARIYRRLIPARPVVLDTPIRPCSIRVLPTACATVFKPPAAALANMIREALLHHFAAAMVLVDRQGHILQFHGQTGKYLNLPLTEPNLNLLDLAKKGLFLPLRSALHQAIGKNGPALLDRVRIAEAEGDRFVRVTIAPAARQGEAEPLFAVIFEDIPQPATPAAEPPQTVAEYTAVQQLEDELRGTQHELQATIAELQASNEDLHLAHEEVVSSNEELQSTIEELKTSKEELQSVNEELIIVNSQLQEKVGKLDTANSDMANLLKSTEIATVFLDRDLRIKLFTPAVTQVLKLIPPDLGRPLSDLSLDFLGYNLQADARAVAAGGTAVEREAGHADGSQYLIRISPYSTPKGENDGLVVTFNDITRMRRAEKQTRRLATVVRDTTDAILLFDPHGNLVDWNRGARAMYGWSEEEALRMNIRDLTPADKLAENIDLIQRLSSGKTVFSFETRRKAKDGRLLEVWLTAMAIWDESGKKLEAVATTERDITDRHKAEKEVGSFSINEELKRKILELAQTNQELEAYIYSISHDLRAPLRSVSEFSRIVTEDYAPQLDAQAQDYLARVRRGAEKMNRLVEGLLHLSRISRQNLARSACDLSKMALAIVAELREAEADRKVEVEIQAGLTAFADKMLINIALANLMGNAWKFTSKTENARIEFGALKDGPVHTAREGLVYYVKDNGAGFNPEYMERMFTPFHRLHTDLEFEGAGIGLATVERIIHRHGGRIWAEGKPEAGATLFFTLPEK